MTVVRKSKYTKRRKKWELNTWSVLLPEKLIVAQSIKIFYRSVDPLLYTQSPVIRAYPEREFINDLYPSGVPWKMYEFLISPMRATFCDNLALLGAVMVIHIL